MAIPASEAPIQSFTEVWHTDTYPSISPSRPELNLKGKNVFITGAGTGIGARTVESFAEAEASNIGILGRREHKLVEVRDAVLQKYPNATIHIYPGSVTDVATVDTAFDDFAQRCGGKLNIYINNAASGDVLEAIGGIDPDAWFYTLEVNVKGSLITTQAFLRHAPEDAVVINVSSFAGFMPFGVGISAYAASKAASVSLFRQLQFERPALRTISIQPGIVKSELNEKGNFPARDTGKQSPQVNELADKK